MTIYMNKQLIEACVQLHEKCFGVELSEGGCGNSHTTTIINVGIRLSGERAYTKKLKIKYTTSYSGQFSEFMCISSEFTELCYFPLANMEKIIKHLETIKNQLVEASTI